MTGTEQKIITY